jgi:hypothetical protein
MTQANQATPATPSIVAHLWHRTVSKLGSFLGNVFHAITSQPQLVETSLDAALLMAGKGESIPMANQAFVGVGELLEAAHKFKVANPGQPLTTAGILQYANFAQTTLTQIDNIVDMLAPSISAKVDAITKGAQSVTTVANAVLGAQQAAPAAAPNG